MGILRKAGFVLFLFAAVAAAADISGSWTFTVETDQGSGTPAFTFKQDGERLTGRYSGLFGQADLTGTVKGDRVEFSFEAEADGQKVKVSYSGQIESDTQMKGKVDFAGVGSGTWTGKRK